MPRPEMRWREPRLLMLAWQTYTSLRTHSVELQEDQREFVERAFTLSLFACFEGALHRDFARRDRDFADSGAVSLVRHYQNLQSSRDKGMSAYTTNLELRLAAYEAHFRIRPRIVEEMRLLVALRNWLAHGIRTPRPEGSERIFTQQAYGIIGRWMECLEGFPADPYDAPE